mmetsp:Transcript_23464/g.41239  ORF Transcript_23464/g.41239 Transcript_23464/m.41239 type:complete len:354 (-) Transcript_23464:958-2019(-)
MSLRDELIIRITQSGPIPLATYMAEALLHPTKGYYTTRDPLGAKGDFVTAPEISQMFGELIGLCLAQSWLDQGAPDRFILAELGPGRGTLMADILRATRAVPGFHAAAQVTLVEASPVLQVQQAKTLSGWNVTWSRTIDDLSQGPLWFVANEFFDALPIHQFERNAQGWCERCVGVTDGALTMGRAAPAPRPELAHRADDTVPGTIIETCPAAVAILNTVASQIAALGGAGLVIDYGDWRSAGDTLQAIQDHAYADPLAAPGHADLTAHVDFEALAKATAPAAYSRVTPQGIFLERLGITARAQTLAQNLSGGALATHVAAHRRLTHPDEMGNLFKVLGIYPADAAPPPGLNE